MVYDGAVKDQETSADPAASAAVSEASSPAPSEAVVRASPSRTAHDKRLGVRHPLKHRRFRAGGEMMVEPGGMPSAHALVDGEEEEEEASELEQEEEETTSADTEVPSAGVEVSSSPASVVPVVEAMEVEGGKTELLPEAAVAVGESELEARPDEEDEVSSLLAAQEERKEAAPAASLPTLEIPKKDEDKEREEKEKKEKEREKQKERERVDEVGYMSGGWKR